MTQELQEFANAPDVIREGLKQNINLYWKSKRWSEWVQNILNGHNHLSEFGQNLYQKMLEAEKLKRYQYKKTIRRMNELLGFKANPRRQKLDIQAIKTNADIAEVAGRYTDLRRRGHNLVGLCPLHKEKNPSFTVFTDGHWHCFGCGEHGDAIDLVRKAENIDFLPALKKLP